jgi:hypothetical protein
MDALNKQYKTSLHLPTNLPPRREMGVLPESAPGKVLELVKGSYAD